MKRLIVLSASIATALSACGCSASNEDQHVQSLDEHARIMDEIESKVQLPTGAEPLEYYARAYKYDSRTRVAAMYFRPFNGDDLGFCESAKSYGSDNGQILLGCPPPDGMKRNERRWLGSETLLPGVSDGGCDYVEVKYDLPSKTVTSVNCNGGA